MCCRDKEHSTIIYESGESNLPLLRLGWNKQDPRYLATIVMDTAKACPPSSLHSSAQDSDLTGLMTASAGRSCSCLASLAGCCSTTTLAYAVRLLPHGNAQPPDQRSPHKHTLLLSRRALTQPGPIS